MWPGTFESIFDPLSPRCCIWNLIKINPVVSKEKSSENVDKHSTLVILGQGHWMTLTYDSHRGAWSSTFFHITEYHCFGKIRFTFSPFKSPRDQIWPSQKIGQGQPRVSIWTNFVVLSYLMLHTKFQGNQSSGSEEEDFLRFLPYMGIVASLVMKPRLFEQISNLPLPECCIWNLNEIGPVVSEEKSFEKIDNTDDSSLSIL